MEFNDLDYKLLSIISKIDARTTKKSNLFQLSEKYEYPNAIILRSASIINTAVKIYPILPNALLYFNDIVSYCKAREIEFIIITEIINKSKFYEVTK